MDEAFEALLLVKPLKPWQVGQAKQWEQHITCIEDHRKLVYPGRLPSCMVCGNPLPSRSKKYCSDDCSNSWNWNHSWTPAQAHALRLNMEANSTVVVARYRHYNWRTHEESYEEKEVKVGCCSQCGMPEAPYGADGTFHLNGAGYQLKNIDSRLEVDHIIPLNGGYRNFTCKNHQTNLRVLCHKCHVAATKEQRKAGLITR